MFVYVLSGDSFNFRSPPSTTFETLPISATMHKADISQLTVTSAMSIPAALTAVEKFAHGCCMSTTTLAMIELEVTGAGQEFVASHWEDLIEFITFMRPAGFEEFKQRLHAQYPSVG
jgi:hypothetical protein